MTVNRKKCTVDGCSSQARKAGRCHAHRHNNRVKDIIVDYKTGRGVRTNAITNQRKATCVYNDCIKLQQYPLKTCLRHKIPLEQQKVDRVRNAEMREREMKYHTITPDEVQRMLGSDVNGDMLDEAFVYFIRRSGSNEVKVGFTCALEQRLASIQTGNAVKLQLEFYMRINQQLATKFETAFHYLMHEQRLVGEWFNIPDGFDYLGLLSEDSAERYRDSQKETKDRIKTLARYRDSQKETKDRIRTLCQFEGPPACTTPAQKDHRCHAHRLGRKLGRVNISDDGTIRTCAKKRRRATCVYVHSDGTRCNKYRQSGMTTCVGHKSAAMAIVEIDCNLVATSK